MWKLKTGASGVYSLLLVYICVYFPAAEARRTLRAETGFPGISPSGVEWLVEGHGSGEGGMNTFPLMVVGGLFFFLAISFWVFLSHQFATLLAAMLIMLGCIWDGFKQLPVQ